MTLHSVINVLVYFLRSYFISYVVIYFETEPKLGYLQVPSQFEIFAKLGGGSRSLTNSQTGTFISVGVSTLLHTRECTTKLGAYRIKALQPL